MATRIYSVRHASADHRSYNPGDAVINYPALLPFIEQSSADFGTCGLSLSNKDLILGLLVCAFQGSNMSGGSSWRSTSTADQFRDHDYADFAQEFLHRNAHYCQDFDETGVRIAQSPETAIEEKEGLAGRWGLCFPQRSDGGHAAVPRPVVARNSTRCGDRRGRRSLACDPNAACL